MSTKLLIIIYSLLCGILIAQFPEYLDKFIELRELLDQLLLKNSSTASITTGS